MLKGNHILHLSHKFMIDRRWPSWGWEEESEGGVEMGVEGKNGLLMSAYGVEAHSGYTASLIEFIQ